MGDEATLRYRGAGHRAEPCGPPGPCAARTDPRRQNSDLVVQFDRAHAVAAGRDLTDRPRGVETPRSEPSPRLRSVYMPRCRSGSPGSSTGGTLRDRGQQPGLDRCGTDGGMRKRTRLASRLCSPLPMTSTAPSRRPSTEACAAMPSTRMPGTHELPGPNQPRACRRSVCSMRPSPPRSARPLRPPSPRSPDPDGLDPARQRDDDGAASCRPLRCASRRGRPC